MSNIKLSNRTLFVALASAAILLFQSFPSAAHKLAAPLAADLTAEKQALSSFGTGLTNLETKVAELQKRSSISSTELNSVKTSASTLKTKVSPIGQTFQSVINKLKASGEWENFDNSVLNQVTDPEVQRMFRDAGGPKKVLQDLASQTSGLNTEIDALVQSLNSKVASTRPSFGNQAMFGFMPVRASLAHAAAAPAGLIGIRCRFRIAKYSLDPSRENREQMFCTCDGLGCGTNSTN